MVMIYDHRAFGARRVTEQERKTLMSGSLPNNLPEYDECAVLLRQQHGHPTALATQTMCFTDLPPEIRNRIYELTLAPDNETLIVASPFFDDAMKLSTQPAITRVSRQVRAESLEMFYASNTFTAYIRDLDFKSLVRWIHCVTSGGSLPKLQIHVKLRDVMICSLSLLELVELWMTVPYEGIHLKIHMCYSSRVSIRCREQRYLVVRAIELAEGLVEEGGSTHDGVRQAYKDNIIDCCSIKEHCVVIDFKCKAHPSNMSRDFGQCLPLS